MDAAKKKRKPYNNDCYKQRLFNKWCRRCGAEFVSSENGLRFLVRLGCLQSSSGAPHPTPPQKPSDQACGPQPQGKQTTETKPNNKQKHTLEQHQNKTSKGFWPGILCQPPVELGLTSCSIKRFVNYNECGQK